MKINKAEFKSIIKESLKELINEGALNDSLREILSEGVSVPQQQTSPVINQNVRAAAIAASGGNQQQAQLMEQILNDTAINSLPEHMRSELPIGAGVNLNALQENTSPSSIGYLPQRNPLPPKVAAPQQVAPASRWASLAFNSPITNRPKNGGSSGVGGFLPGSNKKGSFE